jgi:hypothetical protein
VKQGEVSKGENGQDCIRYFETIIIGHEINNKSCIRLNTLFLADALPGAFFWIRLWYLCAVLWIWWTIGATVHENPSFMTSRLDLFL